jgi:hypothetical protein
VFSDQLSAKQDNGENVFNTDSLCCLSIPAGFDSAALTATLSLSGVVPLTLSVAKSKGYLQWRMLIKKPHNL